MLTIRSVIIAAAVFSLSLLTGVVMPPTVAVGQSRLPPCRNDYLSRFWDKCQGTLTLPDGQKYVGEFRDGKSNGQGTLYTTDGSKYVGEFHDGKSNGQGALTFPNGQKYVGEFKDGNPIGQGTYTFPSGQKYVGEFEDGKFKIK